ncbi:MAG TPA: hypothetical protein VD978_02070 [Azospirillum sp.]|nr:hypothetical protein [Azospirillum sp.]
MPASDNLDHLFESRFPADRSTTFIETENGRLVSYTELEAATARYAHLPRALGVKKGDRVAVQVEKSAG